MQKYSLQETKGPRQPGPVAETWKHFASHQRCFFTRQTGEQGNLLFSSTSVRDTHNLHNKNADSDWTAGHTAWASNEHEKKDLCCHSCEIIFWTVFLYFNYQAFHSCWVWRSRLKGHCSGRRNYAHFKFQGQSSYFSSFLCSEIECEQGVSFQCLFCHLRLKCGRELKPVNLSITGLRRCISFLHSSFFIPVQFLVGFEKAAKYCKCYRFLWFKSTSSPELWCFLQSSRI